MNTDRMTRLRAKARGASHSLVCDGCREALPDVRQVVTHAGLIRRCAQCRAEYAQMHTPAPFTRPVAASPSGADAQGERPCL